MSCKDLTIYENQTLLLSFSVINQNKKKVDISSATTLQVTLRRSGGAAIVRTGSLTNDGTDGLLFYETTNLDLDKAGVWSAQVLVIVGGKEYPSSTITFNVIPRLG